MLDAHENRRLEDLSNRTKTVPLTLQPQFIPEEERYNKSDKTAHENRRLEDRSNRTKTVEYASASIYLGRGKIQQKRQDGPRNPMLGGPLQSNKKLQRTLQLQFILSPLNTLWGTPFFPTPKKRILIKECRVCGRLKIRFWKCKWTIYRTKKSHLLCSFSTFDWRVSV